MLAGVRNVAWGAAMVMGGLLAVILANIWIAYFRLDVAILSGPRVGEFCRFCDTTWASLVELIRANSIIGLAVVIWLIAFAIRRASRSISAHRSFP